jgi:hypothetical protein
MQTFVQKLSFSQSNSLTQFSIAPGQNLGPSVKRLSATQKSLKQVRKTKSILISLYGILIGLFNVKSVLGSDNQK